MKDLRNALLHGNSTQAGQILKKKLPSSGEFEHGVLIRANRDELEGFDPDKEDQGLISHLAVLVSEPCMRSVIETPERAMAGVLKSGPGRGAGSVQVSVSGIEAAGRAVRTASVEVVDVRQAGEFSSEESSSIVVALRQMTVSPLDA